MKVGDSIEARGTVTRVFWTNGEFTTGKLLDADTGRVMSFAGKIAVREDDRVTLRGVWSRHQKYGEQIDVQAVEYDLNLDESGLRSWLEKSDAAKGIGPARARALAQHAATFEQELEDPEAFARKTGVPADIIENLGREWTERAAANRAMVELAVYGITPGRARKLIDANGPGVVGIVKRDPYWLIGRVPTFGFLTVDRFAMAGGVPKDHPSRIEACLLWCLSLNEDDGNTWISDEALADKAVETLKADSDDIRAAVAKGVAELEAAGRIVRTGPAGRALYRARTYRSETMVRDFFRSASEQKLREPMAAEEIREFVPSLLPNQLEAVQAATAYRLSVLSGGAGTGKTWTVAAIVKVFAAQGLKVALCAPTGKAAIRMGEMVEGVNACTIHQLLEPAFMGKKDRAQRMEDEDPKEDLRFGFNRNAANPITADLVVVDEVSMVDVRLMAALVDAIPDKAAVLLVGDHNQLPSVGPGAILRDLIAERVANVTVLDRVMRSAGELERNISTVLGGIVQPTSEAAGPPPTNEEPRRIAPWYAFSSFNSPEQIRDFVVDLIAERLGRYLIEEGRHTDAPGHECQMLRVDPIWDAQVLTAQHKGPIGTLALNAAIQRVVQARRGVEIAPVADGREARPLIGDKVLWTKNDYDLGVMNGQLGCVVGKGEEGEVDVLFDGFTVPVVVPADKVGLLKLAYAMTVHKSQGSEWPVAIVIVHKSHKYMHHRGLLYTAVSRARQAALILGDSWGMSNCARTIKSDLRRTGATLAAGSSANA